MLTGCSDVCSLKEMPDIGHSDRHSIKEDKYVSKTPVGSKILTGVFLWFSMRVAVESVSDFVEIVSNAVDR